MTKEKNEEEKPTEMVMMEIECEIKTMAGDDKHVFATPLYHRYIISKPKKKGGLTNDLRVSGGVWQRMKNIEHEVSVETGKSSSMDEIMRANKFTITTKAVLEMRKREEEKRKGIPVVADEGEKKRKNLLEVAIEDKEKRNKKEEKEV